MPTPDDELAPFDDENVNSFLSDADDSDEDVGRESFESELYGPLENDDDGTDDEPASW